MSSHHAIATLATALLLGACASTPTGPNIAVMPGAGKSFEQFNVDDAVCRQYAAGRLGGAVQSANDKAVQNAAIGTAIGALAGAAIGGDRQGAAVGAGTGLIVGSAGGVTASQYGSYGAQRSYDISYAQCMYARGNNVPAIR
ncbi:MAG TPA: YMGG-like glycine zipper-containing protein [Burkholderiaceae bacterium]